jgi:hypothetical protein
MRILDYGAYSHLVFSNGTLYLSVPEDDILKYAMYSEISDGLLRKDWLPIVKRVEDHVKKDLENIISIREDEMLGYVRPFEVFEVETLSTRVKNNFQVRLLAEFEHQNATRTPRNSKLGRQVQLLIEDIKTTIKEIVNRHNLWTWCSDYNIVRDVDGEDLIINYRTKPEDVRIKNIGFRGDQIVFYDSFLGKG